MRPVVITACVFTALWSGSARSRELPETGKKPSTTSRAKAEEFFEKHIRPLLADKCLKCHGPAKQRGGLRLDSAAGLSKGGDSGPVVFPGEPERSPLVLAVRHTGALRMPPAGKLEPAAVEALATWVKLGAAWPRTSPAAQIDTLGDQRRKAESHWAFQRPRLPVLPMPKERAAVQSPVDCFVLDRLEKAGLRPSPRASRATLIRRVTFDLHGLPPSPDEIARWESDTSPAAFTRLVDRLLASPRFGERWGRLWLDVARYSDTKGYVRLKENPNYTCSWTYRDYVVRAFNQNLPYDRFILEQLAADQLVTSSDLRPLAAMGFLTLGQRFINSQHDIIDDRIDVVTRGLLGLTVACARCHDHKYDPIPSRDYYSLHGVFAGSVEPYVPPLIGTIPDNSRHQAYAREFKKRSDRFESFLRSEHARLTASFRARSGEYLLAAQKEELQANFLAIMFLIDAAKELNPVMVQRWVRFLTETRKRHHRVMAPWHKMFASQPTQFLAAGSGLQASGATTTPHGEQVNRLVAEALARRRPQDPPQAAALYAELFQAADRRWQETLARNPRADRLDDPEWEEIRQLFYGPDAPATIPLQGIEDYFFVDTKTQNTFHEQQRQVEDWISSNPPAPHAMILTDALRPPTPRVFMRGNPAILGESVPRQFLEVLSGPDRRPFGKGSGRLELAQAIVAPTNPLTARVMVNRIWMQLFGAGLVSTPDDFGLRSDPPSHPELLDYLACRFMADGWSLKKLIRHIVLSAVYQQDSSPPSSGEGLAGGSGTVHDPARVDPENRLLWKRNKRRLDWEALRDSLLAVAGNMDRSMGGPSVNLFGDNASCRSSLYGAVDRLNLPLVLRTFDFASPDSSSAQRHETTVPQQALFLMNNSFMAAQASHLAARPEITSQTSLESRIEMLYRLTYGRRAQPSEVALGREFLGPDGESNRHPGRPPVPATGMSRWESYVQALLLANEFAFID